MQHGQAERFKEATKQVKMLVKSHAQQIGIIRYSVNLEDGRSLDCSDRHLLTIASDDNSVSVSLPQHALEVCVDSGNWVQFSERIVEAFCRLKGQM